MFKKILLTGIITTLPVVTIVSAETKFEKLINLSSDVSLMVHELQKERGLSAGYLSSNGSNEFKTELMKQKISTDGRIVDLRKTIFDLQSTKNIDSIKENATRVEEKLNKINDIRNMIENQSISIHDEIEFYSDLNEDSLKIISKLPKYSNHDKDLKKMLNSYYFFQLIKEKEGIIRALGTSVLKQNEFKDEQYMDWIGLNSSIKVYTDAFYLDAPQSFKTKFNELKLHPIFDKIVQKKKIIQDKNTEGNFNLSSKEWYDDMTIKINEYKKVDNKYIDLISKKSNNQTVDLDKIKIEKERFQDIAKGATYKFLDINGDLQKVKVNKGSDDKAINLRMKRVFNLFENGENLELEGISIELNNNEVKVIDVNRNDIYKIDVTEENNLAKQIVVGYINNVIYIGLNRTNPVMIDVREEDRFKRNKRVKINQNLFDLKFDKSKIKVRILNK